MTSSNSMIKTTNTTPTFSLGSALYECSKQGLLIELPISLGVTVMTAVGVGVAAVVAAPAVPAVAGAAAVGGALATFVKFSVLTAGVISTINGGIITKAAVDAGDYQSAAFAATTTLATTALVVFPPAAPVVAAGAMTYTIAFKLAGTSAVLHTTSCTLGKIGQAYNGDLGLIAGRIEGNMLKYAGNAYVKQALVGGNSYVLSEVLIKGGLNGGLYASATVYVNSNSDNAVALHNALGTSGPALSNALAAPIEMLDGGLFGGGIKGAAAGFVVGSAVAGISEWYSIGSNAIDSAVAAVSNMFASNTSNITAVIANDMPDTETSGNTPDSDGHTSDL
jgi:hypothetical protein